MTHKPIQLKNLGLSFPHKACFENFSTQIFYSNRIAIIGRNGSGKSTLLKILQGFYEPTNGDVITPQDVVFGYVPQVIEEFKASSGGQRFNQSLTEALIDANVLLLDEPSNHLDRNNRKSLMTMLNSWPGTLIIVSHDPELLRNCIDSIWHIDHNKIRVFSGRYDDYMGDIQSKRASIEQELSRLERQKKETHNDLMQEQARAAKSNAKGKKSIAQRKCPPIVSNAKAMRAEETSGRKKKAIDHKKQELKEKLSELRLPEVITPKFSITGFSQGVDINDGSVAYKGHDKLLQNINFSLIPGERIAIAGDNGSGKSTFVRAILGDQTVVKSGTWHVVGREFVGYLDQHYGTLDEEKTVFETIQELVPNWPDKEIRRHLNDFLFRKNEEANALVKSISGGEKARLTLAQIAAKTPKLLILDEITNNLDLETKGHIVQVLKDYPGSMIVISHDSGFLEEIGIDKVYYIKSNSLYQILK